MTMEQTLKIMAEPVTMDPQKCRFTLDLQVVDAGSYLFTKKEDAVGSAMAEALFAIPHVLEVFISAKSITIKKAGEEDWRSIGPKIGSAIREAFASQKPLVSQALKDQLPDEKELRQQVQKVIEDEINPSVASHGGYIELLDVKNNDIFIKMGGGCQGCASSTYTLKQGVEQLLRKNIPNIGSIFDTTDHAAGTNPYFQQ